MLRECVVDAAKKGKFHIYPVTTIDEGIEILTGKRAGKQRKDGTYPENTINGMVQKRIFELAQKAKEFGKKRKAAKAKPKAKKRKKTKK